METISKVYLSKMRMSKDGYIGMDYYGYISGTYIYRAIWTIYNDSKEYDYVKYFRANSREEAKNQVIRHITYNGLKKVDIKFYN